MPQRKNPFSGKAKKLQLQEKKSAKRIPRYLLTQEERNPDETEERQSSSSKKQVQRYDLKFRKETNDEIKQRKEDARQYLTLAEQSNLEIDEKNLFPNSILLPQRPPWSYEMSSRELDSIENRYFTEYLNNLEKQFENVKLSHFEENLETWRQLWRVLEMSDILLFIVDIRFANILFPPSVYKYVVEDQKKDMILILNKIDLAPATLVAAWITHFENLYPNLNIILFTSYPGYNLVGQRETNTGLQKRRRKGKLRMSAESAQKLQELCQNIVGANVDLSAWKNKISEESEIEYADVEIGEVIHQKEETTYYAHEKYKEGLLTIGCLGQPNVGKSSIINALMGRKVVSVSKSPGHTKHFQTIYLTKNVRLCDCPGLVFPSMVPKVMQVLMGSFPIAQLREPYATVRYLAERVDLVKLLSLQHPDGGRQWSAMDICDAWAERKGFFTAKAARPDSYRAANSILRMALEGNISLCFYPPGYNADKEIWKSSSKIEYIKYMQAATGDKPEEKVSSDSELEEFENLRDKPHDSEETSGESDKNETVFHNQFALLNADSDSS